MKKTAIEEFIEKLDSYKIPKEIFVKLILADIRKMAEDLLEKEKTQIIEACQWSIDTINENHKAIERDHGIPATFHELFPEDYYNIIYGKI